MGYAYETEDLRHPIKKPCETEHYFYYENGSVNQETYNRKPQLSQAHK